ncbi:MAG: hypothetical protein M3R31_06300 [Pseudomonadota bacterium]|nr:hypothetical protein [Pseudomonadota bacterium]
MPSLPVTGETERAEGGASGWTTRDGFKRLIARGDRPELEQALLRVVIGTLVLLGLGWRVLSQDVPGAELLHMFWFFAAFVAFSLAIVLWNIASGRTSVLRRLLGIFADNTIITYFMLLIAEGGALIYCFYLFVAFGNGFRYGRAYLHVSQILAIVGFALVLWVSDFWSHHLAVGLGMFLAMAMLPLYVGMLAERIEKAKKRADEANEAKDHAIERLKSALATKEKLLAEMKAALEAADKKFCNL